LQFIAYAFHSVDGYSKIGSYTGTGATGNPQFLGFAPSFVMVKSTNAATNWAIFDIARPGKRLQADLNNSEGSDARVTLTSTGFEFTGAAFNETGRNWIFMAFAEEGAPSITRNATDPFGDSSELALYKFEDNANDAEGSYNGTASNVTYATGYINKAAVFNGSTSDIDLPSNVNSTTMSVSFWMYIDSIVSGNQVVIEFANGYGVWFLAAASGKLGAQSSNGNARHTLSNSQLSAGSWHHIAVVWDGATFAGRTFYIDNQVQTGGNVNSYLTCDQNTIGSRRTGEFFDGSIDQVRIFNRALDSGEVTALYNE
jgi:hypothetical protein